LTAFERYYPGNRVVYHYIEDTVTDALLKIPFDVVILDATFLCWRWIQPRSFFYEVKEKYSWLRGGAFLKLAFPQDDYDHAWELDDWLADYQVDTVFTICPKHWEVLYPRMSREGEIVLALTGYIDDGDIDFYASHQRPFAEREIDVGYRVRRLPAYFGRFGLMKSELGRQFKSAAENLYQVDISDSPQDVLIGNQWPEFLGNCRFSLGCEGGSSVLDRRGEVRARVAAFEAEHDGADFEEIAAACLSAEDESLVFEMLSPRIFEIILAGCCPLLIEGDYLGILKPEEHYIPIKRDLSNLPEVVGRLDDRKSAEEIVGRARAVLLGDMRLRYSTWVRELDARMRKGLAGRTTGNLNDGEFGSMLDQHRLAAGEESRAAYRSAIAATYMELERTRRALEATQNEVALLRSEVQALTPAPTDPSVTGSFGPLGRYLPERVARTLSSWTQKKNLP
jgi:hypothetical protein